LLTIAEFLVWSFLRQDDSGLWLLAQNSKQKINQLVVNAPKIVVNTY